ncbi:carboxypeptidase M32 [Candidatus Poribacteria bacterium]|nr:carboxypeptidase M32 [Candidatus Poribacteria bacterium]
MTTYSAFIARVKEVAILGSMGGALRWDRETYMPRKGAAHRGEQLAALSGMIHEAMTSLQMGEWIDALRGADGLSPDEAVNVREVAREYDRQKKIPTALVQELSRVTSRAHEAWLHARKNDDFPGFAPHLERIVALKIAVAEHIGYADDPYDALLDGFEPGLTADAVREMFAPLQSQTVELLHAIVGSTVQPDESLLRRPLSPKKQREFAVQVAADFGFDFDAGRLDISAHPFCAGSHPSDVRMTTRYNEQEPMSALFGVFHETGHGLYEQGLDPDHAYTPCAEAVSLGVHESQSRMWENIIGRSRAFWIGYLPKLKSLYGGALDDVSLDAFHFAINGVKPSLIRVEADELTYNLHILLRFELEVELLNRRLAVTDLPEAWNDRMRRYLTVEPPTDADGVLQDIHWSGGALGYFPTYTLGNLFAAQFAAKMRSDLPDMDAQIAAGRFGDVLDWLRRNIHRQGMRYTSAELVERVAGEPPNGDYLAVYLRDKLAPLYRL